MIPTHMHVRNSYVLVRYVEQQEVLQGGAAILLFPAREVISIAPAGAARSTATAEPTKEWID